MKLAKEFQRLWDFHGPTEILIVKQTDFLHCSIPFMFKTFPQKKVACLCRHCNNSLFGSNQSLLYLKRVGEN